MACDASISTPAFGASSNVAGSGACPYRAASAAQRSRHVDGRRVRDLAVGPGEPDEAPTPWHDPVRVVAAATGRQPATTRVPVRQPIDQPRRLAHRGRGHAQMRERIPSMRIGAVLRHDEVRPERGGQFGEQHLDRPEPRPLPGFGLQRHIHRGPGGRPLDPAPPPRRFPGTDTSPLSWIETVNTPGSAKWMAWTPSP